MARFKFLIIVLLPLVVVSQGFRSRYFDPGAYNHFMLDAVETTAGNYVSLAASSISTGTGNIDVLTLIGLDATGVPVWTHNFGRPTLSHYVFPYAYRRFCKSENTLMYAGSLHDSTGQYLGTLMKFDFLGNLLWQKIYQYPGYQMIPVKVTPSVDGGFLITGVLNSPLETPLLLIKTDGNGNELWRKKISKAYPNYIDGRSIFQDTASKQIYIGGCQDIQGATANDVSGYSSIVVTDSLGNLISSNYYADGVIQELIQTSDKCLIAVGVRNFGTNFIQSTAFVNKYGLYNLLNPIWHIDSIGARVKGNGNTGQSVVELPDKSLLLGGTNRLYNNPPRTEYVVRYVWVSPAGKINKLSYYNYDYEADKKNDNTPILSTVSLTKDGGWISSIRYYSSLGQPVFTVKYSADGCDSSEYYCKVVGMAGNPREDKVIIGPNPVGDVINISGIDPAGSEVSIYDVSSRQVASALIHAEQTDIDLSNQPAGIYFLVVKQSGKATVTRKLIKAR